MLPSIEVIYFDIGDTLVGSDAQWLPGAKDALAALKALGIRLGIISNTGDLTRVQLTALLPLDFDWKVFEPALVLLSYEVGVAKPSPAIFREAVARAKVEAVRCLFCTEELPHTLVAQAVGMRAARVEKPPRSDVGDLPHALQQSGLLAPG
jgi:FMN phosphatase YigB (HAD superfamily)